MIKRNKFDLYDLANEILDNLPRSIFHSSETTFLDPAMGGGQFCHAVENRLREYGHSDENISQRVFGFESVIMDIRFAVNKYKLVGQYSLVKPTTFLETETWGMKFDVIVGNPPFQRGDNDAKRWTLWDKFVERSLELADITAMVTPQSITSPGPFKLIKDKVKIINIDVSKHFDVGSTFCYFVAENKTSKEKATIITDEGEYKLDVKQLDFLPFVFNQDTLNKMEWLMNRESRTWKRGEFHTSNKDKFSTRGKYEVIHTNAQTLKTSIKHENIDKVRVCVSLSGYPTFQVIKGKGCSQATVWTEFNTLKEAREFAKECNDEFIQSILAEFKWSGWNSKEVISHL